MLPTSAPDLIHPFSDAAGGLAGALVLRDRPYHTRAQWRTFLTTLLSGLTRSNPSENIDGLYLLTWTGTADSTTDATLILTRDGYGTASHQLPLLATSSLPRGTLGLISIIREPARRQRLAVLSLRAGYIPAADQLHPDSIIARLVDDEGQPVAAPLSKTARNDITRLGKLMHRTLNKALMNSLGRD